jgi:hypothetical protein
VLKCYVLFQTIQMSKDGLTNQFTSSSLSHSDTLTRVLSTKSIISHYAVPNAMAFGSHRQSSGY